MSDKLQVEIGAEIKELQSKLAKATKLIDKLKDTEKGLTKAFKDGTITADKYYNRLSANSLRLAKVSKVSNDLKKNILGGSDSFVKVGKSAANAVPAVTEFSRVIQDAPFGIQGVANNITQLTQNFGYLKAQTGSTSSALKAMATTLTGPAGILLAVSAVTSLLVAYGDEIGNLIKGNNSLANSQKAVNEALSEFYGNQITKVNSYLSILDDANTSEEQRKNITEELIRIVPNLKKADFEYGNNLDVVRGKIGQYVLAQASRIEADTLVQENSAKLSKLAQINQIKSIKDEKKRITALTKFLKDNGEDLMSTRSTTSAMGMIGFETIEQTKSQIVDTFDKLEKDLTTELKPIQDKISQLYSTTFSGGLGGVDEPEIKIPKTKVSGLYDGIKDSVKGVQDVVNNNPINIGGNILENLDANKQAIQQRMFEIANSTMLMNEAISSSFNGLANSISSSLERSMGAFGAFAGEIIKRGFDLLAAQITQANLKVASDKTQMLSNSLLMKSDAIKTSSDIANATTRIAANSAESKSNAVLLAIKTAAKTPFGAFLLPALLAGTLAAVSSAIGGGGASRGTNAGSTSSSGGSSFSGGGAVSSGLQNVVFEIQGTKLVGVISNTLRRNKNLGGNLSFN